ncbi:hypothetical protein LINGRAHAP2_LOCUS1794 [Linum grandiflorum]
MRLQLLENEFIIVGSRENDDSQYFTKIKSLCREISKLDPEAKIKDDRKRRIIICGLAPEYRGCITAS